MSTHRDDLGLTAEKGVRSVSLPRRYSDRASRRPRWLVVTFLFGAPGKGLDLYHIGLTVPDLRAAMEQYSDAFGFGWATVRESTHAVVVDGAQRQAQIAVTYSLQGPPYLELIEERRGAVWGADGLALTHVGFWAEDVSAAMQALDASGVTVRVRADAADGRPLRYSYHRFGGGLWLELVHPSFEADLTGWIAKTLDEAD
jgi:catechol 2,3-dioxygenase-like lactoylglutathione lyase family enzyme